MGKRPYAFSGDDENHRIAKPKWERLILKDKVDILTTVKSEEERESRWLCLQGLRVRGS